MKVIPTVKAGVSGLKKEVGFKSESEVLAYLLQFYNGRKSTVTLEEHNKLRRQVEQQHRQGEF